MPPLSTMSEPNPPTVADATSSPSDVKELGNSSKQEISLLDCSAEEFASYLLKNRFQNDAVETAKFFLECTSTLPNAESISAMIMGEANDDDDDGETNEEEEEKINAKDKLGLSLPLPPSPTSTKDENSNKNESEEQQQHSIEISATQPRSKFQLTHYSHGLYLQNKREEEIVIPTGSVQQIIVFPKPEDCSGKRGSSANCPGRMVLLCLKTEEEEETENIVEFRKKSLKQICYQLPSTRLPSSTKHQSPDELEQPWLELLTTSLGLGSKNVIQIRRPNTYSKKATSTREYCFRSEDNGGKTSTTTGGMPFVKCYEGVNDGVLYPLREGLLFFKPPKFIPRSSLHSISCGRGSGGSRYVDMVLSLHNDDDATAEDKGKTAGNTTMEFTNISRDELRVLNGYIHNVLVKAMERDAAGDGAENDDDSDNERNASSSSSSGSESTSEDAEVSGDGDNNDSDNKKRRKRSRRAASVEARDATRAQLQRNQDVVDDDEDDEDVEFNDSHAENSDEDELDESDDNYQKFCEESGQSDSDGEFEGGDDDDDDDDDDEEETESESDSDESGRQRSKKARTK